MIKKNFSRWDKSNAGQKACMSALWQNIGNDYPPGVCEDLRGIIVSQQGVCPYSTFGRWLRLSAIWASVGMVSVIFPSLNCS